MQLVIGQLPTEHAARRPTGAVERIPGIRHTVKLEYGSQTPLVERCIVRHERQPFDPGSHFAPHLLEIGRLGRIGRSQPMNRRRKTAVIIGTGANQPVNPIDDLPVAHDHDAHRTDARAAAVGCFEIYGRKIFHTLQMGRPASQGKEIDLARVADHPLPGKLPTEPGLRSRGSLFPFLASYRPQSLNKAGAGRKLRPVRLHRSRRNNPSPATTNHKKQDLSPKSRLIEPGGPQPPGGGSPLHSVRAHSAGRRPNDARTNRQEARTGAIPGS